MGNKKEVRKYVGKGWRFLTGLEEEFGYFILKEGAVQKTPVFRSHCLSFWRATRRLPLLHSGASSQCPLRISQFWAFALSTRSSPVLKAMLRVSYPKQLSPCCSLTTQYHFCSFPLGYLFLIFYIIPIVPFWKSWTWDLEKDCRGFVFTEPRLCPLYMSWEFI